MKKRKLSRIFQWHVAGAMGANNKFAPDVHSPDCQLSEADLHLFSPTLKVDGVSDEFFTRSITGAAMVWTLLGRKPSAEGLRYLTGGRQG